MKRQLAHQRDAQPLAVGVAAGGADIAGSGRAEPVQRDLDRDAETDDQDAVRHAYVGIDIAGEAKDEAGVAAAGID